MPIDNSRKESRRLQRHAPHLTEERQRTQAAKRARGEIACAECNRTKSRCDKQIPCSSCVRKGCSIICPNGCLSNDHGTRLILADTEQLHRKLVEMSERIRQLEDALEIETARLPGGHPLLREELLAIKRGIEVVGVETTKVEPDPAQDATYFNDVGTLSISENGASRFIGRSCGPELNEVDLSVEKKTSFREGAVAGAHTPDTSNASDSMDAKVADILKQLPPYERGWALCETYLEQASWVTRLVEREQVIDELLTPIYQRLNAQESGTGPEDDVDPVDGDELTLLLIIFATGALVDLTLPPYNTEAEHYYQLARSIFTWEHAAESPSLIVVQTLVLLSNYLIFSDKHTLEQGFTCFNLAAVLASVVSPFAQKRSYQPCSISCPDWFAYVHERPRFQGLTSGRPGVIRLEYADCQFPEDVKQTVDENGNVQMGSWHWEYQFSRDILYHVTNLSCGLGAIKYSDVMELDRKVRETPVPKHLQVPPEGVNWEIDATLYMHRVYFAKALLEFPTNPLRSQYAASYLATYRTSLNILRVFREHCLAWPELMVRSWLFWKYAFSALVIVGTVVIRGPNSSLAPAALKELTLGVELFEKSATCAQWARRALSVLLRLRDKAFSTYSEYRSGNLQAAKATKKFTKQEYVVDELSIFSGKSRTMGKTLPNQQSAPPPQSKPVAAVKTAESTTETTECRNPPSSSGFSRDTPSSSYENPPTPAKVQLQGPQNPPYDVNVNAQDLDAFLTTYWQTPQSQPYRSDNTIPHHPVPPPPQTPQPSDVPSGLATPSTSVDRNPRGYLPPPGSYGLYPHVHASSNMVLQEGVTFMAMDDLGLKPVDAGMDEAWSSFMQDSGHLVGSALQYYIN